MSYFCEPYTRRQFLSGLGASVAVAASGGFGLSVWGRNPALATGVTPPVGAFGAGGTGTLVVIEMAGGNDGLNMVVPHASSRYHDLRGALAITDAIDLDGTVGLHPGLGRIAAEYRAGRVAIVEGIGYPDPELSHFSSLSTWWSGRPGSLGGTGWLGRYLDGTVGAEDPLAAVVVGPGPNPAMLADNAFSVVVQDVSGLTPAIPRWIDDVDELVGMWAGFAPAEFDESTLLGQVRKAIDGTVAARHQLNASLTGLGEDRRGRSLQQFLDIAGALVVAGSAPKVIYVHGWGDFDTHQGQAGRHAALMEELDGGVASLLDRLAAAGKLDDVVVMTTSEFGRRASFNGSGTDHGAAASHLIVGGAVSGGRFGEAPDLARLDQRGNPIHTVDYRSYYASILEGWMGVSAEDVLDIDLETLPIVRRRAPTPFGPL